MSYALNFVANFGAVNTGLTLNAKLLDTGGNQTGSTLTTGFHEVADGVYEYLHTSIPDNHRGVFLMYDSADPDLAVGISVNPEEAERSDDILAYLQSLNLTAGDVAAPTTTTGATTGNITVEPYDYRLVTPAELLADLRALVSEPALKTAHAEMAIRSAIAEEDHRPTVALTYDITFDEDACDYTAPCSGGRVVSVTARGTDCLGTGDACYIPIWYKQAQNRIHLAYSFTGAGRITTVFGNRYIADQHTIALATETATEGLWALYIEGQPDLPGSGIVRICGDPWVYACKAGVSFSSNLIDSAESFSSVTGLPLATEAEGFEVVVINDEEETTVSSTTSGFGAPMPDGKHTVLYAQRISHNGRLPESDLVTELAGAVVEWPLVFGSGVHREYVLASAIARAYIYLINSSRSDRDVSRFATLQDQWSREALKLQSKLPKLNAGKARRMYADDPFRSAQSLRTGRSELIYGRFTRVGRLW